MSVAAAGKADSGPGLRPSRRVGDGEVGVFSVVVHEGLDEWADRDDLEAPVPGVVEGASDQGRTEPAPLPRRVDLSVEECEHAAAAIAKDELAGLLALEEEDVAALLLTTLDGDITCGHDLVQERRRRDACFAADSVDDERNLVDVAPAPNFPWLERADDRVRCSLRVR